MQFIFILLFFAKPSTLPPNQTEGNVYVDTRTKLPSELDQED